jgi:hypothetical protein
MTQNKKIAFPYISTLYNQEDAKDDYWAIMADDIAQPLLDRGINIQTVFGGPPFYEALEQSDDIITFNFRPGMRLETGSLWAQLDKKVVTIVLDHPSYLFSELYQIANNPDILSKRYFGVMEENHISYLEKHGIQRDHCFTMAQAGPVPIKDDQKPMKERNIDFMFVGRVEMPLSPQGFLAELNLKSPQLMDILSKSYEGLIKKASISNLDTYDIILDEFAKHGIQLLRSFEGSFICQKLDRQIRRLKRLELLMQFQDYPVKVIGTVSPEVITLFPHFDFAGPLSFRETYDLFEDTKIILNDTINLRNSLLIRCFYAMTRGCVVASDINHYLLKEFKRDKEFIAVYPKSDRHKKIVDQLLSDNVFAQDMSDASRKACAKNHTWAHRIDPLVTILECS